jgi:NADH:ubiquinone oxidoreductase subunit F (NADH-binding)
MPAASSGLGYYDGNGRYICIMQGSPEDSLEGKAKEPRKKSKIISKKR